MSGALRYLARIGAYLIALLLAAVWAASALNSLGRPLFDIGRPAVGDMIISIVTALSLAPQSALLFALLLVCLKLMVGAFLLSAILCAAYEGLRWGSCDDAMLDVALLIAALASAASALPGLTHGGEMLQEMIGELMLCLIASGLAIYGRGYLVKDELPQPTACRARRHPHRLSGRAIYSGSPALHRYRRVPHSMFAMCAASNSVNSSPKCSSGHIRPSPAWCRHPACRQ